MTGALAVVAAVALIVAWWANYERKSADKERERVVEAQKRQIEATEQAQRQAEQALAEARRSATAAAKVAEAAKLLESNQPERRAEASALLSAASRTYAQADQRLKACPDGRRIYPHIGDEADRLVVDRLASALHTAGFIVPRVQAMPPQKMPRATEVRFFRKDEESGALAATAALAQAGLPGVPAKYVRGSENSTSIRPCHYELWIAPGSGKP